MLTQRDQTAVFEASPDAMLVVVSGGVIRDLDRQALRKDDTDSLVDIRPSPSRPGTGGGHVIHAVHGISAWKRMRRSTARPMRDRQRW